MLRKEEACFRAARAWVGVALGILSAACSSTQLNQNTADLSTSIHLLARKQIFYNLDQAFKDEQFVPSQVTLASGSAQTSNSISPTLTVPFAPSVTATNTYGSSATFGTQANQVGLAGPGLSLGLTDSWNQSWTMTPLSDGNQIGRLRSLYNFVVSSSAQFASEDRTLTDQRSINESKERNLFCTYPFQANAISLDSAFGALQTPEKKGATANQTTATTSDVKRPDSAGKGKTFDMLAPLAVRRVPQPQSAPRRGQPPPPAPAPALDVVDQMTREVQNTDERLVFASDNGNVIIGMLCPSDVGGKGTYEVTFRYADPTFLIEPNCVICLDPKTIGPRSTTKPHSMTLRINPRLRPSFIYKEAKEGRSLIGSYGVGEGAAFYAQDFDARHEPVDGTSTPVDDATRQAAKGTGLRAFSDFVLLTYEAMSQTGSSGNGKTNGSNNYVLALPR